jgi:hypothetical protein
MNKRVTTQHPEPKEIHKERGFLLSAAIILLFLRGIIAGIAIYMLRESGNYSTPTWMITLLVLFAIADAISAIAMWFWKKWGFTLFGISTVGGMAIGLMATGTLLVVFHDIIYPAVLAYIIRMQNKWSYFD